MGEYKAKIAHICFPTVIKYFANKHGTRASFFIHNEVSYIIVGGMNGGWVEDFIFDKNCMIEI